MRHSHPNRSQEHTRNFTTCLGGALKAAIDEVFKRGDRRDIQGLRRASGLNDKRLKTAFHTGNIGRDALWGITEYLFGHEEKPEGLLHQP
jgi:hypothetical protein